jgi:predicted transcriptional regulator
MQAYLTKKSPIHDIEVTRSELARRTGTTQPFVSRMMNGHQPVQRWWLIKVAGIYHLSMDEICDHVRVMS